MQTKCKRACCVRDELQDITQEKRTLALCDLIDNVFNDDYTPPPISEWDELILKDITCENFLDLKAIWSQNIEGIQTKSALDSRSSTIDYENYLFSPRIFTSAEEYFNEELG
jgi:hypothetical protein